MSLKALIFDVDGTIASSESFGHLKAFNKAFKLSNLNWHWDSQIYEKLLEVNGGKERIAHYIDKYQATENISLNKEEIDKLHDLKTNIFIDYANKNLVPIRIGIERIINESYEQGLRLAIATTTNINNVKAILSKTKDKNILKKFEIIAAGTMVKNKKPASDIYEYVLQKLELPASDCIAFEDSAIGFKASNAIGIKTIVTVSEYTKHNKFNGAMVVLNNLGEKDMPFEIIKGKDTKYSYVCVDYLKELYEQNN